MPDPHPDPDPGPDPHHDPHLDHGLPPRLPVVALLRSRRLVLEPLAVEHAAEMVEVLAAPSLYDVIGGHPPTEHELAERYARQVQGPRQVSGPQQTDQAWLNWVLREGARPVGTVQATVTAEQAGAHGSTDDLVAALAWVVRPDAQGRGLATEAALAVADHLGEQGVVRLCAWIADRNAASVVVAERLGLRRTTGQQDGEQLWVSGAATAG